MGDRVPTCVPVIFAVSIWPMSKMLNIVVAVVGVTAVVIVAGVWWFLRDDAPAPVSLDGVVGQIDSGSVDPDAPTVVEGNWVIDTETGDFDWDSATGTFAGFRVEEELANIGSATAVGRTGEVSGGLSIDGSSVTRADFTVDMASLRTNNNMRDTRVRRALDTTRFPRAELSLTEPIPLPTDATSGEKIDVSAQASLTLHGVTKEVELAIEARYADGRIVIVGSTEIVFSDFDVEVPSSPVVLSVQDHGIMEFQALMQRG